MFKTIKEALGITYLRSTGQGGGGYISEGEIYKTDKGQLFLKRNADPMARQMFDGELEGLKAIIATGTVRAPEPHFVIDNPDGGAVLVMESLDMKDIKNHSAALGEQVARMHLHNLEEIKKYDNCNSRVGQNQNCEPVMQFGFPVTTCCGYIPQDNTWCDDWLVFFSRKLQLQFTLIEKEFGNREVRELWSFLQLKLPQFFKDADVKPSLCHGDFWSGNVAEITNCPVIFDPAAFYGHFEFDLAIAKSYGGFDKQFWESYYNVLPRAKGWNKRYKVYKLFGLLLEWNHFGNMNCAAAVHLMRDLCW
ncbi:ketosamine-3-kinase-like isoform X2 [Penaeus chinensis]|uniref:ketosamine-3-kinase-like isoform X2 n=1 Tax=Penaeus chinensis TaxID=139456 RepID=UPI001FB83105|nr:ketosamine-3-kinase-like isoform X2 [Penaeus chinensis]